MRTTMHVAMILLLGVGLGFAVRAFRGSHNTPGMRDASGPGPNDVVYTNDAAAEGLTGNVIAATENPDPAHPPADEEWLSRFELVERSGRTVKSEELLGQPYLVSFFFSTCPSICVQQNQKLKELQDQFEGEGVRFVAISVDPETDTPETLREYAARFGADKDQWLFLTGDLTYIRRIGSEIYRQPVDKQFHAERFVLVDPQGKIEGLYSWPDKAQFAKLQDKIREYLSGEDT
jgi:protein SCO1